RKGRSPNQRRSAHPQIAHPRSSLSVSVTNAVSRNGSSTVSSVAALRCRLDARRPTRSFPFGLPGKPKPRAPPHAAAGCPGTIQISRCRRLLSALAILQSNRIDSILWHRLRRTVKPCHLGRRSTGLGLPEIWLIRPDLTADCSVASLRLNFGIVHHPAPSIKTVRSSCPPFATSPRWPA